MFACSNYRAARPRQLSDRHYITSLFLRLGSGKKRVLQMFSRNTLWPVMLTGLLLCGGVGGTPINALADASTSLMKKVERALKADKRLKGADCYTAAPGVVVLYGKVFDDDARTLAEKTARKVHGVNKVVNTLGTITGQWLEQEARINDTLRLNGFENASVRVIGSDVYLSGQVKSAAEKERAARVVSTISNLRVVNFMSVVIPRGILSSQGS